MDIVSHALWGTTIVRRKPLVWWAAFFGALPDLLGSAPGFFYLLFAQGVLWGTDTWQFMPQWTRDAYHLSHSILGIAIVALVLWALGRHPARLNSANGPREWLVLTLPFSFHIFLDVFTHVTDPLARLFFPFVSWNAARVIGVNWWESWWIMGANAAALVLVNAVLWHFTHRKKPGFS